MKTTLSIQNTVFKTSAQKCHSILKVYTPGRRSIVELVGRSCESFPVSRISNPILNSISASAPTTPLDSNQNYGGHKSSLQWHQILVYLSQARILQESLNASRKHRKRFCYVIRNFQTIPMCSYYVSNNTDCSKTIPNDKTTKILLGNISVDE